jgi:tRNA pseudouridine55 synthase
MGRHAIFNPKSAIENPMNGLLIIDKPQGMTSHDVVARARRILREKRIGHAGTLDPMATGVLVLCVGHATRLSEYLLGEDKAYEGVIKLGEQTNTDDAEGEVIATRPVPAMGDDDLRRLEQQFSGEIQQVPPQFSAIQKGGQRAYALARKGETVELDARRVTIHEMRLSAKRKAQSAERSENADVLRSALCVSVRCSAGTYIRSIARDIGAALGCGGHLSALRRVQAGHFTLHDAITLEQLEQAAQEGRAEALLLPMERAVADWPAVHLDDEQTRKLLNGQRLLLPLPLGEAERPFGSWGEGLLLRAYDARSHFIAISQWDGKMLSPVKVFDATVPRV